MKNCASRIVAPYRSTKTSLSTGAAMVSGMADNTSRSASSTVTARGGTVRQA